MRNTPLHLAGLFNIFTRFKGSRAADAQVARAKEGENGGLAQQVADVALAAKKATDILSNRRGLSIAGCDKDRKAHGM